MESSDPLTHHAFDLAGHGLKAAAAYREVRDLFDECAQAVRSVLRSVLDEEKVKVQLVEARSKSITSFREKAELPAKEDANRPKYPEPLSDITDLAGIRVIVYLLDDREQVDNLIYREFDVLERQEPVGRLGLGGYKSTHYLVKFKAPRTQLPEYERFAEVTVEIQVRTILQHGWAEIEHGISYKPDGPVGEEIRDRLLEIAGTLRMADREFQRIDADTKKEQLPNESS
jgi:ppGpp synthetase/RelA/SpoT-type nucleotidyltranferase